MQGPQAHMLPGGRLHLHHGPIDLIVKGFGGDCRRALRQAEARFQTILDALVAELPLLRAPLGASLPKGAVARRMACAVAPFSHVFITPMAAVAGAVADEVLAAMCKGCDLDKAYVNNGGDIAVFLASGQSLHAAIHDGYDAGRVRLDAGDPGRGLATSGWRGRSHSFGIADAVTVVARNAAGADAAATLIANAVNLPDHPAIYRAPASDLAPDSDLGARLVTVDVGPLQPQEITQALKNGLAVASGMRQQGLIIGAALFLGGQNRLAGTIPKRDRPQIDGEKDARLQTA